MRKIRFCWDRTHVPTCQKVTRLPLSYRGDRLVYLIKFCCISFDSCPYFYSFYVFLSLRTGFLALVLVRALVIVFLGLACFPLLILLPFLRGLLMRMFFFLYVYYNMIVFFYCFLLLFLCFCLFLCIYLFISFLPLPGNDVFC